MTVSFKSNINGRATSNWIEDARQDIAYAWRGLRRSPGFTLGVVVVLALGLGANAALFSLLDRVFLATPTGVDAPQEIRRLYYVEPQAPFRAFGPANGVNEPVDYPEYLALRASAPANVEFATYNRPDSIDTRIDDTVVPAMVSYAAQSYFTTLRVRPARGRFFTSDEDRIEVVAPAAVISDAFWHRAFAADVGILGKQVHIGDQTYSIVGIAPRGFDGIDLDRVDMWLPLGALPPPPFWGVSRTMAGIIWPGENPIGKCILTFARTAPCTSVVGVVENVHTDAVIEPRPFMQLYLPIAQNRQLDSLRFGPRGIERVLLVRTRPGTEATVIKFALRISREQLPGANTLRANDLTQVLGPKLRPWRLGATLFGALGVLAAVVAVVGVYSVIAYATSQRAHEMSIRMALGARAQDILALVAGEGLRVLSLSIAIGVAAALAMQRFVASLLYGVSARDPLFLASAVAPFALMGFAAILTPALRAARSDPASALRAE